MDHELLWTDDGRLEICVGVGCQHLIPKVGWSGPGGRGRRRRMATEAAGPRRRYICTATTRENENCVAKKGLDRDREIYGW